MSDTKHTPGPWEIVKEKPWIIKMPEPASLGDGQKYVTCGGGNNEANARRIVACVNALEGITNEELEGWPGTMGQKSMMDTKRIAELEKECDKYRAERDQLLKFAKGIASDYDHDSDAHWHNNGACRVCKAEAIIAKIKGES